MGHGVRGVLSRRGYIILGCDGLKRPAFVGVMRALRVVADAYFANAQFIKPLKEKAIAVLSRLRKNAVGCD